MKQYNTHVKRELLDSVRRNIRTLGYSKEEAIEYLVERNVNRQNATQAVNRIFEVSANVIGIMTLEPFENLHFKNEAAFKTAINQSKLAYIREIKKQRILELARKGKTPEEIETIMAGEILENGVRMRVSLAGILEITGRINEIEQETQNSEFQTKKRKILKRHKEIIEKVTTTKKTQNQTKRLEELRKNIENLKTKSLLEEIDNNQESEINQKFKDIIERLERISKFLNENNGVDNKAVGSLSRIEAAKIINDIRYIVQNYRNINDLLILKEISNLKAFKLCRKDTRFSINYNNLGLEKIISNIQMKNIIESNKNYPQDLMTMAFALVRNKISEEQAKSILKGRDVQLATFITERLSREVSSSNIVEFTEKLGNVIDNKEYAFDIVSRICLKNNNDKAIALSDHYKEEFKEKADTLKRKAEENKKYSEISWQISKAINDDKGEVTDSILDLIESKITQYNLDKSRIIVGKDLKGNSISLEDAQNYTSIER